MDMQTGWNENRALLRGTAAAEPVVSHESHGVVYETFPLTVLRLSGSEDRINVLAPRPLLAEQPVTAGMALEVEGEVRSFNNKSGKGSRLVITLYAKALRPWEGRTRTSCCWRGCCASRRCCGAPPGPGYLRFDAGGEPPVRPGGLPALHRLGRPGPAVRRAGGGDGVRLEGRLQSRAYTKVDHGVSEVRTAYEVSVMKLEPVGE